jgi:hypothetical protein
MWVFTKHGFVSIVQHRDISECLIVRARDPRPLEELWPNHEIITLEDADYRFRILAQRESVLDVVSDLVLSIDYDNFKNECFDHPEYLRSLGSVWRVMYDYQSRVGDRNEG